VVAWSWGGKFGPEYPNRLRAGLQKHLHIDHELVVVTDDPTGLHPCIRTFPITEFTDTPRCRRRMKQYSAEFARDIGATRILGIDLDVVIVDDITPIVDRPEPVVGWLVGYARVFSGSFVLFDAGALHGAWQRFAADPEDYPRLASPHGVGSDQAMLNHYLAHEDEFGPTGIVQIPHWTEADGFVTYFGRGYERLEHHGVGPNRTRLPSGARVVVLGSADKAVMDEGRYDWIREHWAEEAMA
jgi:hypothetical protein